MVELLALVQAEQKADQCIAEALSRRKELLSQVEKERQEQLASIEPRKIQAGSVKVKDAKITEIDTLAKKNMSKAVKQILEEMHV